MANTKKPTKKTTESVTVVDVETKALSVAETLSVPEPVIAESVQTPEPVQKQRRKFLPDDRIMTRSVTSGELIYVGTKSKLYYNWSEYGDRCEVEYADLQALASMKSRFLVDPLFIIEDEELVDQWSALLSPIYNRINIEGIDDIFAMQPKDFKNAIMNAPKGLQNAIRTRAVKMIHTQELYDIRKIKALDEIFGTDLIDMLG